VEKYSREGDARDDYIIRHKRLACWITKATDTHSDYVIFISLPHCYAKASRCYIIRVLPVMCKFSTALFTLCLLYIGFHNNKFSSYWGVKPAAASLFTASLAAFTARPPIFSGTAFSPCFYHVTLLDERS
jgi:hypothetical protein